LHPSFDQRFKAITAVSALDEGECDARLAQLRRHLVSLAEVLASFYDDLDEFSDRLAGYAVQLAALDDEHNHDALDSTDVEL
jgi:hypothetical protein